MKNELLNNIICSKEEEIREKEKELKNIKYNLECAKTGEFLIGNEKDEIKASIDFTEEYIKCKQNDINTLKEMCNRYKKEYNLEGNKMKLSEAKEIILKQFGEIGWKKLKESYNYKVYTVPEEEQLEYIKGSPSYIEYINKPSEEIQLEAIEENPYLIKYISNPSDKTIRKAIESLENIGDVIDLLRHIENDLNEE